MKAVILCGGKGLRMSGGPGYTCKPLVEVGGMPILWHILKIYKAYGIHEFVLCLGHGAKAIKDFFLNYDWRNYDFHLREDQLNYFHQPEHWDIIFADTGMDTMTGGRIKRIQKYIEEDDFMLTYGDGVSDIPLDRLLEYHHQKGRLATVTGIRQRTGYGVLKHQDGIVTSFIEKPQLEGWINGGFFVLSKKVFDYIDGDQTVWEEAPLRSLAAEDQLAVYQHEGFWQSVDTAKDVQMLNELWSANNRPWVKWK